MITGSPDRLKCPVGTMGEGRGPGGDLVSPLTDDPLAAALLTRFDAAVVEQTVERAAILQYDAGLPRDQAEAAVCDLYVATTLDHWPAPVLPDLGRTGYAATVLSDGREYRRLDAAWYGYLHQQMQRAKALAATGSIPAADWQLLRERFAIIHQFALLKGVAWTPAAVAA